MKEIVVIHENDEWLVPLRAEFAKRGVSATEWFLDEGEVRFSETPTDAIYYNRMSASSHTRGHRFAQWPLIVKPNRGGKGLGVQRFDALQELESYLQRTDLDEPLDGTWLLQEYIQPREPFITRAEFIGRKFLYTVQVNTEDGFELCPADNCSIEEQFCPTDQTSEKFTITQRFDEHPIIRKLEGFLNDNAIDVAGIEFIENSGGELFVYDVNTNTNYNQGAEQRAGVSRTGMGALADYLIELAQ